MDEIRELTMPGRRTKSYVRESYRTDTVFTFLRYKDVTVNFAKKEGTKTRITDLYSNGLLQLGRITEAQLQGFQQSVCDEYYHKDCHGEQSPEDIYAFVQAMRYRHFGLDALCQAREAFRKQTEFYPITGIDQSEQKRLLLQRCQKVLFLLCDVRLFSVMKADIEQVRTLGKEAVIGYSPTGTGDLPTRQELTSWLGNDLSYAPATPESIGTDPENACLFFYGEEGLLYCRDLILDSVVHAIPTGYHAQALCNLLGQPKSCVVYIPRGFDITPHVPLTSRTRLTFYHMAWLCRDFGEGVYRLSCEELYEKYPRYFVNIYDTSGKFLPIAVAGDMAHFDENRENAVGEYLNSFSNIRYKQAYFEEEKILVHSFRVTKAKNAAVLSCPKGVTPRQRLADTKGTALVSNFLFFLTEKLGVLYNDLRAHRPREQADAAAGHLDYLLEYRDGKRVETFPLFQKTCIAGTKEGNFLFFSYGLGGGQVTVDGHTLRWEKTDVNPKIPGDICVYTPMLTAMETHADRETYKLPVGQGRVNIVILKERITCIRKGDVILPSVGVVISLTEEKAQAILQGRKPLENGYYVPEAKLTVCLDGPEEIDPAVWKNVQWAYGGGMGLIRQGYGLCDGDMESWFTREGWMSPLSRQTQESALHKLAKHPRTAIGTLDNGELVILVYSGRTTRSSGADYREMIHIARQLYPDIRNLMNVDGGGSAVLGLACEGSFMELSVPATSTGSCVGMVRPINTLFYIPAEKENEK